MKKRRRDKQLDLFPKSKRGRPRRVGDWVRHVPRGDFARRFPVHITLRMRRDVRSLRGGRFFKQLQRSFFVAKERFGVRLVHFAVLGNHIHLIAESEGQAALSKGMQGLGIRIAKRLNKLMERRGAVLAERYHRRILRTPTQVRHATRYVLRNHEHHYDTKGVDRCASDAPRNRDAVTAPRTWLLTHAPPT